MKENKYFSILDFTKKNFKYVTFINGSLLQVLGLFVNVFYNAFPVMTQHFFA